MIATNRRRFLATASAAGGVLAMPAYLRAQAAGTELQVQYSIPVLFKDLMENVAAEFMKKNPAIKVVLRAPEQGYEEIMQRHLRDAVTNTLPDVAFHGLNRQRTLDERSIPVDLKPFMEADPKTRELGFSPSLLSLGQVGGKQTGIGSSLSTPILYYNADLVKKAGGNPEKLPRPGKRWRRWRLPSTARACAACSSTGPSPATGRGRASSFPTAAP